MVIGVPILKHFRVIKMCSNDGLFLQFGPPMIIYGGKIRYISYISSFFSFFVVVVFPFS